MWVSGGITQASAKADTEISLIAKAKGKGCEFTQRITFHNNWLVGSGLVMLSAQSGSYSAIAIVT